MNRYDILAVVGIGALLFGLSLSAGPTMAIGLVLAAALAAAIFLYPIVGLALMILAGTALQVLGSEHVIGLPLSLSKIAGALTLTAWLARTVFYRLPLTYSPQVLALVVFALSLVLSTFIATDRGMALDGLFRYAQLFLLLFMIASLAGESGRTLDQACMAVTASMVLSAVIGLLEFFVPSLSLEYDDPSLVQGMVGAIIDRDSIEGVEIKRITGGLSDSNWFAYSLASTLPLNLYLFYRFQHVVARALILSAAALQSFGIVLSYTRTALVALGVVVVVLLCKRRLPLGPVLAACIVAAAGVVIWNPPGLQRIFSTEYLKEGSTPLRTYLVLGGIQLVRDRPVLGYGYSQFGPAFVDWLQHQAIPEEVDNWEREFDKRVAAGEDQLEWIMPHNTILQIWVEFGLVGFVPFLVFLYCILRDLHVSGRYGSPRFQLLSDCLLAGTLGWLVCALFGHLALLKMIWILGGLAAALRRVALNEDVEPALQPDPVPIAGERGVA